MAVRAAILALSLGLSGLLASGAAGSESKMDKDPQCYIVRKIVLVHCKRGPDRCAKCREMKAEKVCLLDICPEGVMARQVIGIERDGKKLWKEFDIVKVFATDAEAVEYAREHGIADVQTEPDRDDG